MGRLSDEQITARLPALKGWSRDGNAITRTFTFRDAPDAVAFIVRLAFDAEQRDHHPDLTWSFRKVTVSWTTHSEKGITEKDFDGAATAGQIADTLPQRQER